MSGKTINEIFINCFATHELYTDNKVMSLDVYVDSKCIHAIHSNVIITTFDHVMH